MPYELLFNGTPKQNAPSQSSHFGYLAASNYKPKTPDEEAKLAAIKRWGDDLGPRWKR